MDRPTGASEATSYRSSAVGGDEARLALQLVVLDPGIGGLLVRGHIGSGKSALAGTLASHVPHDAPFLVVRSDRNLKWLVRSFETDGRPTHIPDVRPQPMAPVGGVLQLDDVHLLDDRLVEVAMEFAINGNSSAGDGSLGSGTAPLVVVATMNPTEGELAPRLLDRFGLCVDVSAPTVPAERAAIVRHELATQTRTGRSVPPASGVPTVHSGTGPAGEAIGPGIEVADHLEQARDLTGPTPDNPSTLDKPSMAEWTEEVSAIAVRLGITSLRTDLALARACLAHARLHGRSQPDASDLEAVTALCTRHRSSIAAEGPGGGAAADGSRAAAAEGPGRTVGPAPVPAAATVGPTTGRQHQTKRPGQHEDVGVSNPDLMSRAAGVARGSSAGAAAQHSRRPSAAGATVGVGGADLADPRPAARRIPPTRRLTAASTASRAEAPTGRRLVVICVDTSSSPDSDRRCRAAAQLALDILNRHNADDSTAARALCSSDDECSTAEPTSGNGGKGGKGGNDHDGHGDDKPAGGDWVAVIAFHHEVADVVVPPTSEASLARDQLADLPRGGAAPLAEGLLTSIELIHRHERIDNQRKGVLVLLTDGAATAGTEHSTSATRWDTDEDGLPAPDPFTEAVAAADQVARFEIPTLVLDCEAGAPLLGRARRLAHRIGATYRRVHDLDDLGVGSGLALTFATRSERSHAVD